MFQESLIENAYAAALQRWESPFSGFAAGWDKRSSDNALLNLFYGGLVHVAHYDWLNAGRRLIDKTYVDILWHVQDLLDLKARTPEQIAAALDGFISGTLKEMWESLAPDNREDSLELARKLVKQLAGEGFGSVYSEQAASRLLYFLVPMLPIYNLCPTNVEALKSHGYQSDSDDYGGFADISEQAFQQLRPRLQHYAPPKPVFGSESNRELVERLLGETDWWHRRLFHACLAAHCAP
jgi:hypothetical protein